MLAGVIVATATSAIVTAVALAAIWVFLIALTAVWRNPSKPKPRPLMPVAALAVIAVSVGLQLMDESEAHSALLPNVVTTPMQWTDTVWRTFSCYRSSMEGDRREPIIVQWAATPEQIRAQLASRGWHEVQGVSLKSVLSSVLSVVSPNVPATALPALPRLNNGELSKLVFTRSHLGPQERDVLRFWPTQSRCTNARMPRRRRSGSARSCTSRFAGRPGRSTCCVRTAASTRWLRRMARNRRGAASKLRAMRAVEACR